MKVLKAIVPLTVALLAGCQAYTWRSTVPAEMRSVAVPVFRNDSSVTELGSKVTTQVLREFQREGTFRLASYETCAVEVQGVLKDTTSKTIAYERRTGARTREHRFEVEAVVSFIDKRNGKVLVNDRVYTAQTTYLANDDLVTAERDASGRLAEELARQIVDDVVNLKW